MMITIIISKNNVLIIDPNYVMLHRDMYFLKTMNFVFYQQYLDTIYVYNQI